MNWRFWIGLILSGIFLFIAFHRVDLREIGTAFRNVDYLYVVPCMVMSVLVMWFRALRWKRMLEPVKSIHVGSLFSTTLIGFMANNLLPARLGEFVKAWIIGEKEGIPKTASFATIVIERIFDGVAVLLYLLVFLLLRPTVLPGWLQKSTAAVVLFYLTAIAFLLALKYRTAAVRRIIDVVLRPFPDRISNRLKSILESFVRGLEFLHDWKNISIAVALSLLIWLTISMAIHILLGSLGIELPVTAAFLILNVLVVGVMIPSAPGYVGTIQLASVAALALFGVARGRALTFSILYHATQFIPVTVLGLVFFFMEGYSLGQLKRMETMQQKD